MPIPIDERKKPKDVQVHVSSGAGLDIIWTDGHASHYEFDYLREHCPCAMCSEAQRRKSGMEAHGSAGMAAAAGPGAPPGMGPSLPMFKPKPKARAAKAMGHYALQMDFTDGHSTGIYSYTYLREICPCAECAKEFRSGTPAEP